MITLQSLFADALWVLGLAGALATFSYMAWYRDFNGWRWKVVLKLPRLLAPLCLSLTLFSVGMLLAGLFAFYPSPWWQTAAWSVLSLLFALQSAVYLRAGRRRGWDIPIEESKQP